MIRTRRSEREIIDARKFGGGRNSQWEECRKDDDVYGV
jgi:hypothetical protein